MLRELAILQVACASGCEYERLQHGTIALGVGASNEQVTLLATPNESRAQDAMHRAFTTSQRAVISFTDQVVGPGRVAEAEVVALREHLSDRGIVELLLVIGHYSGIALLAESVRLDLDESAQMAVVDLAARNTRTGDDRDRQPRDPWSMAGSCQRHRCWHRRRSRHLAGRLACSSGWAGQQTYDQGRPAER